METELVLEPHIDCKPHDLARRLEGIWALLPLEAVLFLRDDVAADDVARLSQQHVDALALEVEGQR